VSERYDFAVIGAGIVGLSTALALKRRFPCARLLVLERESEVGAHQTGNNSGVVHSGIYYRPGSEKARLCLEGGRLLSAFCEERSIPLRRCGKVIVATEPSELALLDELFSRGQANGVGGLELIGPKQLMKLEPHAAGLRAIHSPRAAVVDFRQVARAIADEVCRLGAVLALGVRFDRLVHRGDDLVLSTSHGQMRAAQLVNCAGVYSDVVAKRSGARPSLRIVPFRGEYFSLRPQARHLVRGLIYPVPDPRFPFLGVHLTRTISGEVEAGPNAVPAFARDGYRPWTIESRELFGTLFFPGFWALARRHWRSGGLELVRSIWRKAMVKSLKRLIPEIRSEHLVRAGTGIRAQAVEPDGTLVDDFRIIQTEHALHVLNAPSPAATASLAIGQHLANLASVAPPA
jgi:(S)-2-hydroxyglutarate dehydrogenase